ncbi:MAG: hypothetical protein IPM88_16420 [Nitrospira sp.]|nr:hypothetical protein [Nitrospira sp.]
MDTRLTVWAIGLRQVATHPVVGIGYGNNSFVKKFPEYSSEAQAQVSEGTRIIPAMHNTFLMVALGERLPALPALCLDLCRSLRRLIPVPWRAAGNDRWSVRRCGYRAGRHHWPCRNLFD